MQYFGPAMASSPLPDSTALEAGILEDECAPRLSRVQGNVRELLRTSIFGSVASSPTLPAVNVGSSPSPPTFLAASDPSHALRSHPPSPVVRQHASRPEVVVSPIDSTAASSTHSSELSRDRARCTPGSCYQNIQRTAHQSAPFNTRAVAALNHHDLHDPFPQDLSQQKLRRTRHHGWVRSRSDSSTVSSGHWRRQSRRRYFATRAAGSQRLFCILAALLLAALVATYVALAATIPNVQTTFHVLFVLGILLAVVVFAHSIIRFCLASKGRSSRNLPRFVRATTQPHPRRPHQRPHRHHGSSHRGQNIRQMPALTIDVGAVFFPPTPIHVSVPGDDTPPDSAIAYPTAAAATAHDWDKVVHDVPNPPPAYGRWRDSVRAHPDLPHWQAVPSPVSPETPAMPSPTYEEAMASSRGNESGSRNHPPSYATRDSPARQREVRDARAGLAVSQVADPEMVEIRAGNASPGVGETSLGRAV